LLIAEICLRPLDGGPQDVIGEIRSSRKLRCQRQEGLGFRGRAEMDLGGCGSHGEEFDVNTRYTQPGGNQIRSAGLARRVGAIQSVTSRGLSGGDGVAATGMAAPGSAGKRATSSSRIFFHVLGAMLNSLARTSAGATGSTVAPPPKRPGSLPASVRRKSSRPGWK